MRLVNYDALMHELEIEVDLADDWKTAHEIANVVKYAPTIEITSCFDCQYATNTVNGEMKYCDVWSPDDKVYINARKNFCSLGKEKDETDG